MTDIRKFHVEITFTKTVEVEVDPADLSDGDDIYDLAEEEAVANFWNSERAFNDDYTVDEIKEVSA